MVKLLQRRTGLFLAVIAGGCTGLAAAEAVRAQGEPDDASNALESVVVTAQRRAQDLQEVPLAVSALSSADLERAQVNQFYDLDGAIPNVGVKYSAGSVSTPGVYIRGIGLVDSTWNVESGVGVYVDDQFISGTLGGSFMIMDMERIEVLRGPQGTLYGRNSTGGAVKWVVRRPNLVETAFKGDMTFGSRNRKEFRASGSVPVIENQLAFKFDGVSQARDGYVTRISDGRKLDYINNATGRVAMLWKPSDSFEAYVIGTIGRDDSGPQVATPTVFDIRTGVHTPVFGVNQVQTGVGVRDISAHDTESLNVQLTWKLGSGELKSISTWRHINSLMSGDLEGLSQGITAGPNFFINIDFDQAYEDTTYTQEFDYSGAAGESVTYIAGVYFYKRDLKQDTWTKLFFPAGMRQLADQTTESYAVFADATWTVSDRIDVFGGVRYTEDKKEVDHTAGVVSRIGLGTPYGTNIVAPLFNFRDLDETWDNVSGRLGVQFRFRDNVNVYASVAQGFKPGQIGVSRGPDPINSGVFVDEETSTTIELGVKSKLLDDSLLLNANVFNTKYEGYQTGRLDGQGNLFTTGSDFELNGAELEATWRATENVTFFGSYGYLENKFDDDPQRLQTIKDMPENNVRLGFDLRIPTSVGTFGLASDYRWQDDVYFANVIKDPGRLQKAYGLFDAQIYYQTPNEQLKVTFAGQNLGDELYALVGNNLAGALNLQSIGIPFSQAQWNYADGTTWSVSFSYTP